VQFERILAIDPYRIDDIDVFSNVLYATDNRLKLSRLAHEFLALDKDRPEVCCLVGLLTLFGRASRNLISLFPKEIITQCGRSERRPSSILGEQHNSIGRIYLHGH
jgi:hypothetical protein